MTEPRVNTRVEGLAEAIENLAIGVGASALEKVGAKKSKEVQAFIAQARTELRGALREFLTPLLRVVDGARQPYSPETPAEDRVICGFCKKDHMCSQPNCERWHSAVRAKIAEATGQGDEEPDDAA